LRCPGWGGKHESCIRDRTYTVTDFAELCGTAITVRYCAYYWLRGKRQSFKLQLGHPTMALVHRMNGLVLLLP
jgi:hypothetical protein